MAQTRQATMIPLLLFYLISFTHAGVTCPGDYSASEESGTCIKFVFTYSAYTWSGARDQCKVDGGDLVKIVNQAMNDLIYQMSTSDSGFTSQSDDPYLWIGLSDRGSTWVWLDETDAAAWVNWIDGQGGDKNQDCAVMDTEIDGEWRDVECDDDLYWDMNSYMCEIPALTTTTSIPTTTEMMTTRTTPTTTTTSMTTSLPVVTVTTSSPVATSGKSFGGLSVGALVGIVIGVLVVAALVLAAFLAVRYSNKRQRTADASTDRSVAYTKGLDN